MATLTTQPDRISYTRRDIDLIDEEVDNFITHFIPAIKNTKQSNIGRLYLRLIEALVDKLNYSLDVRFRQSVLRTVREKQAAIDITELVRYHPQGVSTASVDLTLRTLTGPAPVGGIAVPQYSVFTTNTAPVKQYLALEAFTIPEGASELENVQAIQGTRVVDQVLLASATGEPSESVRFPVARTPYDYITIKVDGTEYTQVEDFRDSEQNDRHYMLKTDEDLYITAIFGDGSYGKTLSPGSQVTGTYIQSLGESANTPRGTITKVVGSLSSSVSVTNPDAASGGSDGDTLEDIVRKAPKQGAANDRAVNDEDFEALAEKVSGVYQALKVDSVGAAVKLYIMPLGGGVASTALLQAVEAYLKPRLIHGAYLSVQPLASAHILISMNVVLYSSNISKSIARKNIYEALSAYTLAGEVNENGALYFRNLRIGRGFAFSDISAIIEGINDGELVDYVDYTVFTRYPTPVAENLLTTVEFIGEVVPNENSDYATWVLQATSGTTYAVYKNGVLDSNGTIGVEHTTSGGELTFTLGLLTDTFNIDDSWTMTSSEYRNNMKLGKYEFMELARSSDLNITVYYPDEIEIGE